MSTETEFTFEDLKNYSSGNGFDKSQNDIEAIPYIWRDPKTIQGRHYIRKFVSATIAPGGLGKSALALVDAVSMTTGRDLLGCLKDELYALVIPAAATSSAFSLAILLFHGSFNNPA